MGDLVVMLSAARNTVPILVARIISAINFQTRIRRRATTRVSSRVYVSRAPRKITQSHLSFRREKRAFEQVLISPF